VPPPSPPPRDRDAGWDIRDIGPLKKKRWAESQIQKLTSSATSAPLTDGAAAAAFATASFLHLLRRFCKCSTGRLDGRSASKPTGVGGKLSALWVTWHGTHGNALEGHAEEMCVLAMALARDLFAAAHNSQLVGEGSHFLGTPRQSALAAWWCAFLAYRKHHTPGLAAADWLHLSMGRQLTVGRGVVPVFQMQRV
jgi:hypothetical protein